jgi:hypothetical protein
MLEAIERRAAVNGDMPLPLQRAKTIASISGMAAGVEEV